jgi:hypothetical protein
MQVETLQQAHFPSPFAGEENEFADGLDLIRTDRALKRDGFKLNRHHALASCLSMIFSDNRFPLLGIML